MLPVRLAYKLPLREPLIFVDDFGVVPPHDPETSSVDAYAIVYILGSIKNVSSSPSSSCTLLLIIQLAVS